MEMNSRAENRKREVKKCHKRRRSGEAWLLKARERKRNGLHQKGIVEK